MTLYDDMAEGGVQYLSSSAWCHVLNASYDIFVGQNL